MVRTSLTFLYLCKENREKQKADGKLSQREIMSAWCKINGDKTIKQGWKTKKKKKKDITSLVQV